VRDNRDIAQVVLRRCLGHSAVVYPILTYFSYGRDWAQNLFRCL